MRNRVKRDRSIIKKRNIYEEYADEDRNYNLDSNLSGVFSASS